MSEELEMMEPIRRLDKDLKAAARLMGKKQARHIVDMYYTTQDVRIRADSQVRAANEAGEPCKLLEWNADNFRRFEGDYKRALDAFTDEYTVGRWLKSICGIGPVISAGLLANLDITQAPTAGHFISYAGLVKKIKWMNKAESRKLVVELLNQEEAYDFNADLAPTLYAEYAVRPREWTSEDVLAAERLIAKHGGPLVRAVIPTLARVHNRDKLYNLQISNFEATFDRAVQFYNEVCEQYNITNKAYDDEPVNFNAMRRIADHFGRNVFRLQKKAQGPKGVTVDSIATALSKRPYNANLKTLAVFKLGECFVKVQGNKKDYYGGLFRKRRDEEETKNAAGEFKAQAEEVLEKKKIGKDTDAYKAYITGKLPPAHLHARARRWVIQLFLSHLHHVMFVDWYDKEPPPPYALEYLEGHIHEVPIPNWPFADKAKSLKEMKE